jgi:uncharacterized phage-associated protein
MQIEEISTASLSQKIGSIIGRVQRVLSRELGDYVDERLVEDSIRDCVAQKIDRIEEGMLEMFTTPGRREYEELVSMIASRNAVTKAAVEVEEMVQIAQEHGDESVFEGFRTFSKAKMAAMIEHLTAKGHHVYKTSLNKLLFYSDLTYFYLRNQGMSGAVYYNRPYGPVAAPAEPILNELVREGKVNVLERTKMLEAAPEKSGEDVLTREEKKLLDWIADTYGEMSAGAISDLSHREMAYKFTEPNEPIAYAYGKFLKHLPPKNLLDA